MLQSEALNILKTGANVFLTGEPGAGKTHTINQYVRYLKDCGINPAITASTGIAATHVNGMTIHSWSGIGIAKSLSEYDLDELSSREPLVKRANAAKVLIIDEISMLDASVLTLVDQVMKVVRRNDQAFGGLQVIFVGDFFQLPPIARRGEEPAQFCFESPAWAAANPLICYLSEQHRQEDETYLSILSSIRRNDVEEGLLYSLEERRVYKHEEAGLATKLYTHNADVDRINLDALNKLPGEMTRHEMTSTGRASIVEKLKMSCISPSLLHLKEGAVVMFTKNNFEGGYVNGTLGTVIGFEEETQYPIVETHKGDVITVQPADWVVEENGKQLAKITQLPLRLAWAITIHKSQGMSLDAAVIDLSQAFEYGQGYVALSRVRSREGLFLLGMNSRALEVHPKILEVDAELRARAKEAAKYFSKLTPDDLATMQKNFITSIGGKIPDKKKVSERREKDPNKKSFIEIAREGNPNAFRRWSIEQENELKQYFANSLPLEEIAQKLGRRVGGIVVRLKKLELLPEDFEYQPSSITRSDIESASRE